MGRYLGWIGVVGLVLAANAAPAQAQVRVGVQTRNVGVNVAIGSPRVYVVDRDNGPYYYRDYRDYRDYRYYRPRPVRGWERVPDRGWAKREREYYKDVRKAEREYYKDIRDARRDYAKDIRKAGRNRRR